jgi:hypothetical protein
MGGPCSTYGSVENVYKTIVGNLEKKNHSEDLGIDGRMILE